MFALFFLHFVPFFSDWLNFVAQELKPKEKIYLVNKLHASCRLSHSAHIKTLRKTITITKRCRINGVFLDGPVLLWDGPSVKCVLYKTFLFFIKRWSKKKHDCICPEFTFKILFSRILGKLENTPYAKKWRGNECGWWKVLNKLLSFSGSPNILQT